MIPLEEQTPLTTRLLAEPYGRTVCPSPTTSLTAAPHEVVRPFPIAGHLDRALRSDFMALGGEPLRPLKND